MDANRYEEAANALDYMLYKFPEWNEAKLKKAEALAKSCRTAEALNYLKSLSSSYASKA